MAAKASSLRWRQLGVGALGRIAQEVGSGQQADEVGTRGDLLGRLWGLGGAAGFMD